MDAPALWRFLFVGYAFTVAIELPILLVGLSRVHSLQRRAFAGFWLTACTYPIVVLVLPVIYVSSGSYVLYLCVAELFAAVAEVGLFRWAFSPVPTTEVRDALTIVLANLCSFVIGQLVF